LFECVDDNAGVVTFVRASIFTDGRDAVEYMAYVMFPLSAEFGFGKIVNGKIPVSKIVLPLLDFLFTKFQGESDDNFRARVELGAENVVGSYNHVEHDACVLALPNKGRLNWVFEKAGVAYGPRPIPGTDASKEATMKRKADVSVEPMGKWVKVAQKKRAAAPKAATAPRGAEASASRPALVPTKTVSRAALPKPSAHKATSPGATMPKGAAVRKVAR
jgi:hypothetical protein